MDETEFRDAYHHLNQSRCAYEKAIMSGRCVCRFSQKMNIAEREAVTCQNGLMQGWCNETLQRLTEKARFSLRAQMTQVLTHAQSMKVQVGGILGVQKWYAVKHGGESEQDISKLVFALHEHEDFNTRFPSDEVIQSIVHFKARGK